MLHADDSVDFQLVISSSLQNLPKKRELCDMGSQALHRIGLLARAVLGAEDLLQMHGSG